MINEMLGLKKEMEQRKITARIDWLLVLIICSLFTISLLAISSAQTSSYTLLNFIPRQIIYYGIFASILIFVMMFDMEQIKKMTEFFCVMGILGLVVLIFMPEGEDQIGEVINGAKSWYHTRLGSIQPSEFMKTFYILACAKIITAHNEKIYIRTYKTDLQLLVKIGVTLIVPFALIFQQPDLGSALVFLAITAALLIASGMTWKIIVPIFLAISALGSALIWMALEAPHILKEKLGIETYKLDRIYSWLEPEVYASDEGYQLLSSMNAIGSGGIVGKGYMERSVYVVENHTDFIFTVIGEEWGFIGASTLICLYFMFIYRIMTTALKVNDPYSSYICVGIIAMLTFHIVENIGMTIQLLPITGIPLPFISYGGSSLMGNGLAIGLIFSMNYHYRKYTFAENE